MSLNSIISERSTWRPLERVGEYLQMEKVSTECDTFVFIY